MVADIVDIIVLSVPLAGLVLAAIAIYFEYKKNMAMIEKGIIPAEEKDKYKHNPENKLAWGIVILGIGLSFLMSWRFNFDGELTASLIFISIGIGLLVFWKRTKQ